MSYDVSIGGESFNYTFNLSKLFYEHMPNGKGVRGLHGMTGKEAAREIGSTLEAINRTRLSLPIDKTVGEPDFCAKYDAPNGWGSTVGAIMFLAGILAACALHPRAKVGVWA